MAPRGVLQLTSPRDLAVGALAGGIGTWVLVTTIKLVTRRDPLLAWSGPLVLWFVAAIVVVTAVVARRRFRLDRAGVTSEQAVTFLVLGKAGALAGAVLAAGYAVFGLMYVQHVAAEGPRERVIRAGVAAVAGVVVMVSGLWLERGCRVPDADDDDDPDAPGGADPAADSPPR